MDAIEICIRGDIYLFENQLTNGQLERIKGFTLEYCMSRDLNTFNADEFVNAVESSLRIVLKRIKISQVIAI